MDGWQTQQVRVLRILDPVTAGALSPPSRDTKTGNGSVHGYIEVRFLDTREDTEKWCPSL